MTHTPQAHSSAPQQVRQMSDETSLAEVFRQSLRFLRRYLTLILAMGLLGAFLALVASQTMERLYKSTVQLMIDPPADSPIKADSNPLQAPDTGYVDGQLLLIGAEDTLIEVVRRGNLTEVPFFQSKQPNIMVRAIYGLKGMILGSGSGGGGLPEGVPDRATLSAKNNLDEAISVSREGDTNVISISVRANSPALAYSIANLMADTYKDIRLTQRREAARELSDWIEVRAEELRQQVAAAEQAVTDYRIANGLFADEKGISLSDQQLTELNAEFISSRADLAQKRAALRRAREVFATGGDIRSLPEAQTSEIIIELRNQMLLLELRERDMSATASQNNPRLTQVRQQYQAIRRQLDNEISLLVDTLANEVETLESRTELLSEALSQAGGQSGVETQVGLGLRQLERVAEAYRQHYQRYLDSAGLAAELRSFATSGTQIVTSASVPLNPFSPSVKVMVILSFILGSMAAIVIGLARDALDTSFRSAQQVEAALGTKVRALIPMLEADQRLPNLIEEEPQSLFAETISVLRFMLFSATARKGRAPTFLITSNGPDEGKTSIASTLALSASLAGQNVLLIDGDLRRAGLTTLYNMEDEVGFADVLQGSGWAAPDIMGKGVLDVLPAGLVTDMPLNALESPRLGHLLELARQTYDLIVIDGPPVAHLADCTILSEQSDQLLFVVRWGQTLRDQAARALQRLPRAKLAGVVLNGCPPSEENGLGATYRLYSGAAPKLGKLITLPTRPFGGAFLPTDPGDRRA
ncbi:MAG: hypothetical protein HKN30_00980 [Sulfitobacter sp.]|nr:hypothetical protein [Sulfitobacter sp.]